MYFLFRLLLLVLLEITSQVTDVDKHSLMTDICSLGMPSLKIIDNSRLLFDDCKVLIVILILFTDFQRIKVIIMQLNALSKTQNEGALLHL